MMNEIVDCPVSSLMVYSYFAKGRIKEGRLVSLFSNGS